MLIEIKIENNLVEISLKDKSKVLDKIGFPEAHNLSEKLLATIDRLIAKNKLRVSDIKKLEFNSDVPNSYTTFRIVSAVKKAFNWAVVNM